ncbi:hypothetical protein GT204_10230 [Streptomyces sp. SID4919]|nr:hypothetical protein [Streptomyces sp. SID4919]
MRRSARSTGVSTTDPGRAHHAGARWDGVTRPTGHLSVRRRPGTPPSRDRTDHNPLDRKEYLLRVTRKVTTRSPA